MYFQGLYCNCTCCTHFNWILELLHSLRSKNVYTMWWHSVLYTSSIKECTLLSAYSLVCCLNVQWLIMMQKLHGSRGYVIVVAGVKKLQEYTCSTSKSSIHVSLALPCPLIKHAVPWPVKYTFVYCFCIANSYRCMYLLTNIHINCHCHFFYFDVKFWPNP